MCTEQLLSWQVYWSADGQRSPADRLPAAVWENPCSSHGAAPTPRTLHTPASSQLCLLRALIVMIFSQCCGNEKWGDWRPHLAAMLSNETGDPAVQQKAIVTMGDTLGMDTPADDRPFDIVSIQIYELIGLCCCSLCSLQRPLKCRPCVLPDSQRSLRGVHAEGRPTGASWQQPQVNCPCSSIHSLVYLPSMPPQC